MAQVTSVSHTILKYINSSQWLKMYKRAPLLGLAKAIYYYSYYHHHFVWHCGAFCGLKWRIWRAKLYFSPRKVKKHLLISWVKNW